MLNFKEVIGLAGPILIIVISIFAIKMTEDGWKKFWKILLWVAVALLIYRSFTAYVDVQSRKQEEINTVCQELLSTYNRAACLKLRN